MQLGFILNSYSQSKAAGERLLQVLDERDLAPAGEEQDAPKAKALNGHVTFSDVSLVYNEANEKALHTISFDAPPGKVISWLVIAG